MKCTKLLFLLILMNYYYPHYCEDNDFYKLLGVPRDATLKEIRKAFKNLAVKLHPDKNPDDKEANAKFIKVSRAYEILKDPDTRKHYDLHGDTGSDKKHEFRSYSYYTEQFGIYDDDPLIVTLSKADYEVNVLDDSQAWFVNFYSPHCHHCHELAPTWRKLASELEGVIRIAAVNCEDDWTLCYQLSINSYPSLLYYEKEAHLYEGEKYRGPRTFEMLKDFILSKLTVTVKDITSENWESEKQQTWLLFLCSMDNFNCPEHDIRLKMAAILEGLMSVGLVTDSTLCDQISNTHKSNPVILWNQSDNEQIHEIVGSDSKEILQNVLTILPNPESLNESQFKEIRSKLRSGLDKPWLLCFYLGTATDLNLQLKRLPSLIPSINIGLIHCGKNAGLCSSLHINRYPSWGMLKVGGAFEMHYGRDVLHEVATFARDSAKSTNLHALSPADFQNLINEGNPWFVDWYAPWCPPCRRLMPELRRASQHFDPRKIQFGTVDCTLHRNLCAQHGINSYPTTVLYNGTKIQRFHGVLSEDGIVEFVSEMLAPSVITLDERSFDLLSSKPATELWVVDFFAPWCGPCQKLAPEWRKLAKQMTEFKEVRVAQVDCVTSGNLCNTQNIRSYPTIRLYPLGSKGMSSVALYNGNRDVVSMKRWILNFLPSPVISMNEDMFRQEILTKAFALPWLVDFYAPWCGHCIHFEPEFRKVATKLEGLIRSAKIDCEAERVFCGTLYVNSYPSVFLYLSPTERHEISSQSANDIISRVKQIINSRRNRHDEL